MADSPSWSTPVLAERVTSLAQNFNDHVEHSETRANTMTNQLAEIVRISHGQALTLTAIEAGQKTVKWLLGVGLTLLALGLTAAGVGIAAIKLVSP